MNKRIAVLGLGNIGLGAAGNLKDHGFDVIGIDISEKRRGLFAETGGEVSDDLSTVISDIEVLLVCLVSGDQIDSVLTDERVSTIRDGSIIIVTSTVAVDFITGFGARCARHGVSLIDAPVSGGERGAMNGTLSIFAAGKPEAIDAADDVLKAVGEKIYRLGPHLGTGSKYKIVHQLLAGIHVAAAAEGMALAEKSGLDLNLFYDIVSSSAGRSWMFEDRGPRMIERNYESKSDVNIFVKDLGLALELARECGMETALGDSALAKFTAARNKGYGTKDDSSLFEGY